VEDSKGILSFKTQRWSPSDKSQTIPKLKDSNQDILK